MSDDAPTQDRAVLRVQVAQAIADYIASNGDPERLRPTIVAQFPQIPRTTAYKWIKQALETGSVGKRMAERRIAVGRGVEVHSIAAIPVAQAMSDAIRACQGVLAYAQGDDPMKPRNPKLTLSAATSLARTLQLATGLHQALVAGERVEAFYGAMMQEIAKESPDLARRVTDRLRAMTSRLEA